MDLRSMYKSEIEQLLKDMGEKSFRAGQIYSWLHEKHVRSYDEMTNISKDLREKLKKEYPLVTLKEVDRLISKADGTNKFLFQLGDGNVIESVLMRYHHGNSVCVSSQVGCAMGCVFCASTKGGLVRSLTASEILEQVYEITRITGERVSNIVVMGMGEPLQNYDNLVRFIRIVSDDKGINISQRNITVSTCGLVEKIYDLAKEDLSVTLALSLHATTDERRERLMPIARKYKLKDVMKAMKDYFKETGRRVSFEYALVAGENDTDEDAANLKEMLKGFPCHVNLIPVNTVVESGLKRPIPQDIDNFHKKLENFGINVTIRREMGSDINGACGQLRKSYIETSEFKL